MSARDSQNRGRARASMREVAELAQVAMSSVSRVLNDHPDVSPQMRERVLAAVEQLGYSPDVLAQSLRRRETRSVGFIVGDISNPLLAEIVEGAESVLRDAGYAMLLTNSEGDADLDASYVRLLEQRRIDGLVVSTAREGHAETNESLAALDVPIVVVDRDVPADLQASRVLSDHRTGMKQAVEALLDLGHRRIGLIAGQRVRPSNERRRALQEVYAERDLPATYVIHEGSLLSKEEGARGARELLDLADPPTALIAGGNQLLIGALEVIVADGLELGRDISLVSCDDVAMTELFRPPIAVVQRDTRALGVTAAELLLERMRDQAEPRDVVLPTQFVPRPSCAAPRSEPQAQGSAAPDGTR